jgi:glycosyltransferase involved in cell wall biosynthesis
MAQIHDQPIRRVLYVERTTWLGGSAVSLDGLLRGVDTRLYQPLILTQPSNLFTKRWEELGEVILDDTRRLNQPGREKRNIAGMLNRTSPAADKAYLRIRDLLQFLTRDRPAARRLARILVDRRVDLIHNNSGLPFDRAMVLAGWLAGINQVCHFRALTPLSPVDRWLAGKAQAHICVSQAVREYLVCQGISDRNLHVIYNPVDLEAFTGPVDKARTRENLGLRVSDIAVANVGRLDWWKGQDIFVKAIGELRNRWPNLRAVIVGDCGPTRRSVDYCEQLRKTISELGLHASVILAGLRLDIPSVMAASDLIVHSATEPEPLGRVIMEGMAAGRPVIASAAGGVKEIVKDRETGILVPPGSPAALADGIELLLREPLISARIGIAAQAYARHHFSIQNHWDSVSRIYEQVMGSSSAKSGARTGNEPQPDRAEKQGIPQ